MKSVLYVQHTDPSAYPPIENSAWIFAERGWEVMLLGVMADGGASELKMRPHSRIELELQPPSQRGMRHLFGYAAFLARCRAAITQTRPDVVYCSDLRSYAVGLWASYRSGLLTVMHEHDSPPYADRWSDRILLQIRQRFAKRASLCVIPQEERSRQFRNMTDAERVCVVYNCPSLRDIPREQPRIPGAGLTLWYHGSIVPSQFPASLIEALARLPDDVRLEFAGYETVSSRGYVERLMAMARMLGVAARVRYRGRLPLRTELLASAAAADVGVALFEYPFREPMVGASNKPFDYLACGLPLLTNATPEWQNFFGASGVSVGCDPSNAEDIARAIYWLRDHQDERLVMAKRGRMLVQKSWNYEAQFAEVMAILENGVCSAARAGS